MTRLFNRRGRVVVDTIELVVDRERRGLDISFKVTRTLKPAPNTAEVRVWNLSRDNRARLESLPASVMQVSSGYKDGSSIIFSGAVRNIVSSSDGESTITDIEAGDGEKQYQESRCNITVAPFTSNSVLVTRVLAEFGLGTGNLAQFSSQIGGVPPLMPDGGILSGSAAQLLTRVLGSLGFEWSIQDEALQILRVGQPTAGSAVLLTPTTGLVGSPSVDTKGLLKCRSLLQPELVPGRLLDLRSRHIEGVYRAETCVFSGDSMGGDWYVDVEGRKA